MKRCLIILVAIFASVSFAVAQDIVKGKVVDKKGNPLPGAKVSIKHTPEINDTATVDKDGNFTITWSNPYEKKMIVTYPGMNTRSLKVDKNDMNIKMTKTTWWTQRPKRPELYAGLQLGFPTYGTAHPAMGLMLGYFKIVGVYAKFMRNLDYSGPDEGGGYTSNSQYFSGKTKMKYMSGSLGLTVRLKSPFYLYAGASVAQRELFWQGADGVYYQVDDDDVQINPEVGILFRYKHIAINAALGYGYNFGVGYIF